MRRVSVSLALLACSLPVFAERWHQLPTLPDGFWPNSEVSTNVSFVANTPRLQNMHITLELYASSSNSLSVAIGEAAGQELTFEEADFEWGYDCGAWFYKDTATGVCESEAENPVGRVSRTLTIPRREIKTSWNRIKITKRGLGNIYAQELVGEEYTKFVISIR